MQNLRRLELYDLRQPNLHKFEAELQIKTNFTGSEMTLKGKIFLDFIQPFIYIYLPHSLTNTHTNEHEEIMKW